MNFCAFRCGHKTRISRASRLLRNTFHILRLPAIFGWHSLTLERSRSVEGFDGHIFNFLPQSQHHTDTCNTMYTTNQGRSQHEAMEAITSSDLESLPTTNTFLAPPTVPF